MSDSSISIVPTILEYPNHIVKAKEILHWLIAEKIVSPEPSACTLGASSNGYAVGEGASKVVLFPQDLPFDLITNGLDVVTELTVFDPGENIDEDDEEMNFPESNLGFTFWNWPEFTDEFINEFRTRLNCEITIVYCHI
jgi:hypothetical protein